MRPSLTLRAMVGPRITRGGIVGRKAPAILFGGLDWGLPAGSRGGKGHGKSKIQNPESKIPAAGGSRPAATRPVSRGNRSPRARASAQQLSGGLGIPYSSGNFGPRPPLGMVRPGAWKKVSFAPKGKNNFIDKPCFGIRIAPDGCGVLLRRLPRRGAVFFLSFSLLLCFLMALTTRYRFASPERVRAAAACSRRSAFLAFLAHPRQNNQRFLRVPNSNHPQQRDPKNPDARRYGDGRHHHLHQNDGRHGAKHAPRDRQRVSFFPLGR